MARSRVRIWLIIFFVPILLVLGGIGYLAWRQSVPAVRVEFSPVPKFIGVRTPITLATLREHSNGALKGLALLKRGNRLSITPVSAAHWKFILSLEH